MSSSQPVPFATTVDYHSNPQFAARARLFKRPPPGKLSDAVRIFRHVLQIAAKEDRLLLSSSWGNIHPELVAAAWTGFWPRPRRPKIYLLGCMWEPNTGLRGWIERKLVQFADRSIDRYLVQSTEELEVFPRTWKVPAQKVRFCPFFYSFSEKDLVQIRQPLTDGFIFAGGNSMRNYLPLVEAARRLPEVPFIFATHLLDDHQPLPPNVKAGQVSHQEFVSLMVASTATVVPIQSGLHRAAGQQTYLNAMWMGKPTIVSDALGVRDHIRDRETGLITAGTPESYVEALCWLLDPANREAVEKMGLAARKDVRERFSFEKHVSRVLEIIDEASQEE